MLVKKLCKKIIDIICVKTNHLHCFLNIYIHKEINLTPVMQFKMHILK